MLGIVRLSVDLFISNNIISNNLGSGIHVYWSSPILANNLIVNNSKLVESGNRGGAGLYLHRANPLMYNNTICNNSTNGYGGG